MMSRLSAQLSLALLLTVGCAKAPPEPASSAPSTDAQASSHKNQAKPSAGFEVALGGPEDIQPGQEFTLRAQLHSLVERPGLQVTLTPSEGASVTKGLVRQVVDLKAGEPLELTWTASVPDLAPRTFALHASHSGRVASDGVYIGDHEAPPVRVMQTQDGRPVME